MNSYLKRYEIYDYLIKKIDNNDENNNKISCLDKSSGNIFELFYYDSYKYKLANLNIFLLKVIGEQSLMGTVYLSKYKNYKFITKIMLLNKLSTRELDITKKLSDISYNTKNIHLPLLYGHSICNKINIELKLINDNIYNPKNSYYCLFIELYEGSMYIFLLKLLKISDKDIFKKYFYNIINQCLISILTCHINNIYHNDSHINNFLYCYSSLSSDYSYLYKYKDLEFSLNSYPYIISICDFGLSSFINENNEKEDFKKDYKILFDSINKYYINKYNLNDKINLDLIYEILNSSINDYDFFNNLKKNLIINDDNDNKNKEIIINLS